MLALVAIVAMQLLVAALLFGTLALDRDRDLPRPVELRHRPQ